MKLSPFTLIYQPEGEPNKPQTHAPVPDPPKGRVMRDLNKLPAVRKKSGDLIKALDSISPNLSKTLIASTFQQESINPEGELWERLERVVTDLTRSQEVVTVALWDLDARVGRLPEVIELINEVQSAFTFFDLRAPVPAGLVIRPGAFVEWARKRLGKRIVKSEQENLHHNFMFNDFYKFARVVRERVGVDYIVGLTRFMIAWEEKEDVHWNYFSTYDKQVIMVSAYDMPKYAQRARRPLESAIAAVVIAQLLPMLNKKLRFHENRKCLFDFNEERDTIVDSLRKLRIEPGCLSLIEQQYREPAEKMLMALREYSPKEKPPPKLKKSGPSGNSDEYWLAQLTSLSSKIAKG